MAVGRNSLQVAPCTQRRGSSPTVCALTSRDTVTSVAGLTGDPARSLHTVPHSFLAGNRKTAVVLCGLVGAPNHSGE